MRFLRWRNRSMGKTSRMWCLDTLSSIAGTVIGIVLTFGVTFWIEFRDKKEDNKKIAWVVLENISMINYEIGKAYQRVEQTAPAQKELLTLTPEKVEKMPEDSINFYLTCFPAPLFEYQDFARSLLNNNFDILRSSNNLNFLINAQIFYSCYNTLKILFANKGPEKLVEDINAEITESAINLDDLNTSNKWELMQIAKSMRIKYLIKNYLEYFISELQSYKLAIDTSLELVIESFGLSKKEYEEYFNC